MRTGVLAGIGDTVIVTLAVDTGFEYLSVSPYEDHASTAA